VTSDTLAAVTGKPRAAHYLRSPEYGAAFTLPAIGYILAPFLPSTPMQSGPSRKAWLQSSLAWRSRVLRNFSRICSHTPWSCHSFSLRWQVDRLPCHTLLVGPSRPPDLSTHKPVLSLPKGCLLWCAGHRLSVYLYVGVVGAAEQSAPTAGLPTPHPSPNPLIRRIHVKFRLSPRFWGPVPGYIQ